MEKTYISSAILGLALLLTSSGSARPLSPYAEFLETTAQNYFPGEVELIESLSDLSRKSARQFDFFKVLGALNTLGKLGGALNPSRLLGGNNNNNVNGVQATTPRLNGRPGLGFIPDVSKGVDTILQGVNAGNLEQILEGSFVFAPTGVQLVAGNVLDRVFRSTPASSLAVTQASTPVTTPTAVPTPTTTTARQYTPLSSSEAQKQLQQIIRQQQQLQALQVQLEQQAQRLQSAQQKQASEQEAITEGPSTSAMVVQTP